MSTTPFSPPHARFTLQVFSPNQLYRKGMVFWEMFRPYVTFLKEVDAISSWGSPRRRCVVNVYVSACLCLFCVVFCVVYYSVFVTSYVYM